MYFGSVTLSFDTINYFSVYKAIIKQYEARKGQKVWSIDVKHLMCWLNIFVYNIAGTAGSERPEAWPCVFI